MSKTMCEGFYFIVWAGSNKRICYDHKNLRPYVYDDLETAQNAVQKQTKQRAVPNGSLVPILFSEYERKYAKFVEKDDEITLYDEVMP